MSPTFHWNCLEASLNFQSFRPLFLHFHAVAHTNTTTAQIFLLAFCFFLAKLDILGMLLENHPKVLTHTGSLTYVSGL